MNFFENIAEVLNGYTLNITVMKKDDGNLVVSVYPKLDKDVKDVQSELSPLVITATPDELDREFFAAITSPMRSVATLAEQVSQFDKSTKEASKKLNPNDNKKKEKDKSQTKLEMNDSNKAATESAQKQDTPQDNKEKEPEKETQAQKSKSSNGEGPDIIRPKKAQEPEKMEESKDAGAWKDDDDFGDENW